MRPSVQDVQAALGPNERPAVNAGGPGAGTPPGLVNPLGLPTFVCAWMLLEADAFAARCRLTMLALADAFNGAVFEVMRNGRLASVTLFVPFQRRAAARAP